ncbi:polymerase, partial [Globisporangium splendens]
MDAAAPDPPAHGSQRHRGGRGRGSRSGAGANKKQREEGDERTEASSRGRKGKDGGASEAVKTKRQQRVSKKKHSSREDSTLRSDTQTREETTAQHADDEVTQPLHIDIAENPKPEVNSKGNPNGNPNGESEEVDAKSAATNAAAEDAKRADVPRRERKKKKESEHESKPKEDFSVDLVTASNFKETAWFTATGGNLRFAQWLFGRCQGMADVTTMDNASVLQRVHQLYRLEKKIQQELLTRPSQSVDAGSNDDDGEEHENGDGTAAANAAEEELWSVAAIVDEVRNVLRVSRKELLKQQEKSKSSQKSKQKKSLERTVYSELIENATELLLNRASFEEIPILERWMEFLNEDVFEGVESPEVEQESSGPAAKEAELEPSAKDGNLDEAEQQTLAENESVEAVAAKNADAKLTKREKRQQKQQQGKIVEAAVCEQLEICIAFLRECQRVADENGRDQQAQTKLLLLSTESPIAAQLVSELNQIYSDIRINVSDEARRLKLTRDLQQLFRRKMDKWRKCEMILFGSSLSHYGSMNSDLDLCLIMDPSIALTSPTPVPKTTTPNEKTGIVSSRILRSMINGKTSGDGNVDHDLMSLHELLYQVKKSIEKTTALHRDLEKTKTPSRGQLKQMQQLRFFRAHLAMLRDAILDRIAAAGAEGGSEEAADAVAQTAATRMKELVARSRRQSEDLFRIRVMLERSNCEIRMVISGARIPIIRFRHVPTQLDCDLCFENVLATRNTFLLRAYASFDERARILGLAIKHWAKQRAINDASVGFLSSYSFVLLTVYFLQVAAKILPNLQDPQLLADANVAPEYYNGVNIAFCADRATAQRFHESRASVDTSQYSSATLLVWFFEFYSTHFDFAKRVVAIRSPDVVVDKRVKWGVQKAKAWRMSIEDPLETGRDLGCVLQFKGQSKILQEVKRAHKMLKEGKSFTDIAVPVQSAATNKKDNEAREDKKENKKSKHEDSVYLLTLWSHDTKLTKVDIQRLLKCVDTSLRVGKIEKAVDQEHNDAQQRKIAKWLVELLVKGSAAKCPRVLKNWSRIDFVPKVDNAATNSKSVVWLHHHTTFTHEPCTKCLSPAHAVGDCSTAAAELETIKKKHVFTVSVDVPQTTRRSDRTLPTNTRANGLHESKENVVSAQVTQGGAKGKQKHGNPSKAQGGAGTRKVRYRPRRDAAEANNNLKSNDGNAEANTRSSSNSVVARNE